MITLQRIILSAGLATSAGLLTAQEGALDPTFNTNDVGFGQGMGVLGTPILTLQPDGMILIGGTALYNGRSAPGLARANANGSFDAGFNIGTGANSNVWDVAVQADGKILIGGSFTLFNGVSRNGIARLNTDGSLDTGFDPGSGVVGTVYSLNIQADGKIILTGNFLTYNGIVRNNLARVNSNGSLDTSFDPGTGANFEIADAVLQPDGKLLIGGSFTTYGGVSRNRVARVLANGMLDSGFNPGTGASDPVSCIALRSDGRVMIGGSFINYNSTACGRIARLNSNGSLDATFNTGTGANGAIDEISIQPDGKIVLGGSYTVFNGNAQPYLVRVNTNGTFDTGFATTGDGGISSIALRSDGSMLIGGVFTTMGGYGYNGLARLNTDGNTDLTFNPGSGVNSYPTALAVQQDGKVLLGGGFSGFNGPARKFLARLLPDGSLDASYDARFTSGIWTSAITVQPDGKALVGGVFWTVNGITRNGLVRLGTDGSVDTGFDPGSGTSGSVDGIIVQPDGKILICGQFTTFNGAPRNRIARLLPNGNVDSGFDPGSGANQAVRNILLRPDGKIVAVGAFTTFNGLPRNGVVQLNPDGSVDQLVDFGAGADASLNEAALQADGKVLISGWFTTVNGTPRNKIARLNVDGTLDSSFDPGTGLDMPPTSIVVQPDSKIMIGGFFTTYNGTTRNRVAMLMPNGDLDPNFDPGTGPSGAVLAITPLPDGKHVLGGQFISYNGIGRNNIARINGTPRASIRLMLEGPYSATLMNDALRTLPTFPLTQPFTAMGYAHPTFTAGSTIPTSILSTTGNNAIVDWVIVEMRPAATPGTVAASRAVLLQRDGDVVDLDGVSTVGFPGLAAGSYCVAIRSRNHLPVMLSTATPVTYGSGIASVDFTLPTTQVYDGGARVATDGVMVLAAGDVNFNGTVRYTGDASDRDLVLLRIGGVVPTATLAGYWPEDANMDGAVKYTGPENDRDVVLRSIGGVVPTNTRSAALP
jgi:uncharacterized delta-60 repeat protein